MAWKWDEYKAKKMVYRIKHNLQGIFWDKIPNDIKHKDSTYYVHKYYNNIILFLKIQSDLTIKS